MKNGLNKFAKGIFAIFTIKLLFISIMLINQSCETDNEVFENNEQKFALEKFKNTLAQNNSIIENFTLKSNNLKFKKEISLEQEAKVLLNPVLQSSQDFLNSYGFTKKDLIDEFGTLDNNNLIMMSLAILDIERNLKTNNIAYNNSFNFFIQTANAQKDSPNINYDQFKHCLFDAFEIKAIMSIVKYGVKNYIKRHGKKTAIRIIGKFLAKSLGWVGTAWAIVDFGKCMANGK